MQLQSSFLKWWLERKIERCKAGKFCNTLLAVIYIQKYTKSANFSKLYFRTLQHLAAKLGMRFCCLYLYIRSKTPAWRYHSYQYRMLVHHVIKCPLLRGEQLETFGKHDFKPIVSLVLAENDASLQFHFIVITCSKSVVVAFLSPSSAND